MAHGSGPAFEVLASRSRSYLDLMVGQIQKARVLLVVTHRPDYQPRSGVSGNSCRDSSAFWN